MAGVSTYIEDTVYANVIAKAGRNELQLGRLADDGTLAPASHKFELLAEETVSDGAWVAAPPLKKKRSRDPNASPSSSSSSSSARVFCAVLPTHVAAFDTGAPRPVVAGAFAAVAAGNGSVWAALAERVEEFALDGTPTGTSIAAPEVRTLHRIHRVAKQGQGQLFVAVAGDKVQLLDSVRKLAPQKTHFAAAAVAQLPRAAQVVAMARHHEVVVRHFGDVSETTYTTGNPDDKLVRVVVAELGDDEYVLAVSQAGSVFVWRLVQPVGPASADDCAVRCAYTCAPGFENVYVANGAVYGVWHDGVVAASTRLPWTASARGVTTVDVGAGTGKPTTGKAGAGAGAPNGTGAPLLTLPEETEATNMAPPVLHRALVDALAQEDSDAVLVLCSATTDDDTIKHTVKLFHTEALPLFVVVADEVALDPLALLLVLLWLRWLLLLHGLALAGDPLVMEPLRRLESQLGEGMKVLKHLLALQGRLQLLKSQGSLRKLGGDSDDDEEPEEHDEPAVVFANGETDDA